MDKPIGRPTPADPIHREHRYFFGFLTDLHLHCGYAAANLLEVIEKPWKWQAEFDAYVARMKQGVCT